ncbi:MAG: enoyl-CoA hydratase/isomerase family protein [Pseudomonadales bacterium]
MQTISEGPVLVARDGATARITFNRPEKKNAVSNQMLRTVIAALEEASVDEEIRSILLTGQGDYFSSGRDIKDFDSAKADGDTSPPSVPSLFMQALTGLLESPKPTIAAVRGFALGGGQAISLACDFLVAERTARFGNVEMAYGFPAAMNIALLSRHLGRRLALEIAITGELYGAERYWELGLVNRLANPGELEAVTDEFVNLLNSREPWAVRRTKQTFRMAEQATEQGAMHLGDELNHLLFNGRSRSVHSGSGAAKDSIKKGIGDTT